MKVLFVVQGNDFWNPLGLMQVAAIAKQRGDKTYLAVLPNDNILDKIEEIKPDVVAYGSSSHEHKDYLMINQKVKSKYKHIFTIMGGSHPTFFPEVINEGNLDAVCIGEGELAFAELLKRLEKGEDVSSLKNIVIKGGKFNGLYPLIQDLDSLPFPDRELFYENSRILGKENSPAMNFITSRGCPFNCTYCFNHALRDMYHGQKFIRRRSVDNVLQEVEETKDKFNLKFVKFVDDIFITKSNYDWLYEFCGKYPKKIGLPFLVYTRFDMMTQEIARLLKKAGCTTVFMSIESPNQKIRENILKRRMSDEQIIQGAKYCREEGISIIAYTMLGLPTSTLKDDINAVDFSIKAGVNAPEFPIFQPLPKTELSNFSLEKGFLDECLIRSHGGFNDPSVLNCFTQKEKNAQRNISALGPIAVRHPFLRNLVMNYLIYLPHNKLFNKIYAIDKIWTYSSKIYKTKYSLRERFDIIKRALRLEKIRWRA